MLKLKINLTGLEKGEKQTNNSLKKILQRTMFKMEELAIKKAPTDRGLLRQKITIYPHILVDKYVVTSAAPYSQAIEEGTIPMYVPIKLLKEWARRKLGDENIGYAVQDKIAKVGIKASPFMRPAFHETRSIWMPQFIREELAKKKSGI